MIDSRLLTYIKTQKSRGFTKDQVIQFLSKYGYDSKTIEDTANKAYQKHSKLFWFYVIAIPAIVILAITILILPAKPVPLTLQTSSDNTNLLSGELFEYTFKVTSPEPQELTIITQILKDGIEISKTENFFKIGRSITAKTQIQIPSGLESGTYQIKSTIGYTETSINIQVQQRKIPEATIEPQTSINKTQENQTTIQIIEETQQIQEITIEQTEQNIDQITSLAKEDLDKATNQCSNLLKSYDKDTCMIQITEQTGNSAICDLVKDDDRRDACLIAFIPKGEKVCSRITNPDLKQSCENYQ